MQRNIWKNSEKYLLAISGKKVYKLEEIARKKKLCGNPALLVGCMIAACHAW